MPSEPERRGPTEAETDALVVWARRLPEHVCSATWLCEVCGRTNPAYPPSPPPSDRGARRWY